MIMPPPADSGRDAARGDHENQNCAFNSITGRRLARAAGEADRRLKMPAPSR